MAGKLLDLSGIKPNPMFLSWCTGFYEGEGTALFSHRLLITVTQKEKSVLSTMVKELGFGKIYISRYKGSYVWKLTFQSRAARLFAKLILPHMKSAKKIKQINRALKKDNYAFRGTQII